MGTSGRGKQALQLRIGGADRLLDQHVLAESKGLFGDLAVSVGRCAHEYGLDIGPPHQFSGIDRDVGPPKQGCGGLGGCARAAANRAHRNVRALPDNREIEALDDLPSAHNPDRMRSSHDAVDILPEAPEAVSGLRARGTAPSSLRMRKTV